MKKIFMHLNYSVRAREFHFSGFQVFRSLTYKLIPPKNDKMQALAFTARKIYQKQNVQFYNFEQYY